MFMLGLIVWVWMVAGGIALFVYKEDLPGETDFLTLLILMAAWPWWLGHHGQVREARQKNGMMPLPIKVEHKDRIRKDK